MQPFDYTENVFCEIDKLNLIWDLKGVILIQKWKDERTHISQFQNLLKSYNKDILYKTGKYSYYFVIALLGVTL